MPQYLFIAEKPSLAQEIAASWAEMRGERAERSREEACWKVGGDKVTWLFGHMYELASADTYDPAYKKWDIGLLPIVPKKWLRAPSDNAKRQISAVARHLKDAVASGAAIVNAGDAAREGQLLVDELLIENGVDPFSDKVGRLWCRSLARADMISALESMELNSARKGLYESAFCRQKADWLHGINLTRLFTQLARKSGGQSVISVGRVQTPTLRLVVDRDLTIENFKPVDHFVVKAEVGVSRGRFRATWKPQSTDGPGYDEEGRLLDVNVAKAVAEKLAGKTGTVKAYKDQEKQKAPPLPYNLSSLQTACSAKFGFSAKKTLQIAQELYEKHKITSYPRTDSRYLPTAILEGEVRGIVAQLSSTDIYRAAAVNANMELKSAAWNDEKVSDHHAIIPTSDFVPSKLASLQDDERKVFDLIVKSFLVQFYPAMRYRSQSATIEVIGETLEARGRRIVDRGWEGVFGPVDDDEEDDAEGALPEMTEGENARVGAADVEAKRTTPPARFTDGTLIKAMSNIHLYVTDPGIKKRLKENDGIGTEATRADIIETIIRRKFVERKGKHLISTEVGRSVIAALPEEVKDPGMTAAWEGILEGVARGTVAPDKFMETQEEILRGHIDRYRDAVLAIATETIEELPGHGSECPQCKKGKMITRVARKGPSKGKRFLCCEDRDCGYIHREPKEKPKPLPGHGETCPKCEKGTLVTRMARKGPSKGKSFLSCNAYPDCSFIRSSDPPVEPLPGHGQPCSQCAKGKMVTKVVRNGDSKGKKFLSCDQYPTCKNAIFDDAGKTGGKKPGKKKMFS